MMKKLSRAKISELLEIPTLRFETGASERQTIGAISYINF